VSSPSLHLGQHCFLLPSSLGNRAINSPFLDLFEQPQANHIVIYPFYNIERDKMAAPAGFSRLVQVLDLSVRLLLPQAVSSNVAAFLRSMTSSGEDRWLNSQIQRSRRMVYANFATTADWVTSVLVLLRASRY